jgi:hypothetical protein
MLIVKSIALFVALIIVSQLIFPTFVYALSSGPKAPEFTSFEPVGTSQMVNELTGAFTYNIPIITIPGPDGGSYSMSLSYHSGISPEQDASWVGYGWTLNPGAINRTKQGFPDDYKSVVSERFNKIKPIYTTGMGFNVKTEVFSKDKERRDSSSSSGENAGKLMVFFKKMIAIFMNSGAQVYNNDKKPDNDDPIKPSFSVSFGQNVRYNSVNGYAVSNSLGGSGLGMASVGLNISGGDYTMDYSINPMDLIRRASVRNKEEKQKIFFLFGSEFPALSKLNGAEFNYEYLSEKQGLPNTTFSTATYNVPAFNYSIPRNISRRTRIHVSGEVNYSLQVGTQLGIDGSMQIDMPIPKTFVNEHGFCYPVNVNDSAALTKDEIETPSVENDYRIDNASTFNKHDKNIGIPLANYDVFNVSGQSTFGGFRFHLPKSGMYNPYPIKSTSIPKYLGIEGGIGATWQVGVGVGIGSQIDKVESWDNVSDGQISDYLFDETQAFPQFINDPASLLKYKNGDLMIDQGLRRFEVTDIENRSVLNTADNAQSAKIEYSTFNTGQEYLDKGVVVSSPQSATGSVSTNSFAQFAMTNSSGEKAYYGLPVWTYDETELTVGVVNYDDVEGLSFKRDCGENQSIVYQPVNVDDPMQNLTAVGRKSYGIYANQFLLTKIEKANYIDVNNNKITDTADLGGWTRFGYRRICDAFRYRFPYTGLNYDRGSMVDLYDQTGSFSSGKTEKYYLQYVETKSHIGFFVTNKTMLDENSEQGYTLREKIDSVTNCEISENEWDNLENYLNGSNNPRYDGFDAAAIPEEGYDPAANSSAARGENEAEYLEKIVLFSKNDFSKPLQTVYFEYDYELCQNAPSNSGIDADQKGKLTLKRVWTENGNVKNEKITPYEFDYEYFRDYPNHILSRYGNEIVPSDNLVENPEYSNKASDPWGNYRWNGSFNVINMFPWLKQNAGNETFDPAAWHLKRIVTPTGGEIHVQYEQNSYTHVQNRPAMSMVSLKLIDQNGVDISYKKEDGYKYYVNTLDVSLFTPEEKEAYCDKLYNYFVIGDEPLYFKMLFAYHDNVNNLDNDLNLESSDFIDGYVDVDTVGIDSNGIFFELGSKNKDRFTPRWTAYRKLLTEGRFNLGKGTESIDNGYTSFNKVENDQEVYEKVYQIDGDDWMMMSDPDNALSQAITSQIWSETFVLLGNWMAGKIRNYGKKKVCKKYSEEHSYFRLPVPDEKIGGGVRVKRLLTYNPGFEEESFKDAMLFGKVFHYVQKDGKTSSGVALNEPAGLEHESALRRIIKPKTQGALNNLLRGDNYKQFEAPLASSLYPGAVIYYSRILIENLNNGKSSPGFVVKEFTTPKEIPSIIRSYNELDPKSIRMTIPAGPITIAINNFYLTQSYKIYNNADLLGKPVSETVYPGTYIPELFGMLENAFVSRTTYKYTELSDPIETIGYSSETGSFNKGDHYAGYEESLTMFSSKVSSVSNELNFEVDLNCNNPAITIGIGFGFSSSNSVLAQYSTAKEIRRKSFLSETISESNGIVQRNEVLAYDKITGNPILTRVFDGFMYSEKYGNVEQTMNTKETGENHSGWLYSVNLPAYWFYHVLGPVFENSQNSNRLDESAFSLVSYGKNKLYDFLQETVTEVSNFENVVSASATVYKNDWEGLSGDYLPLTSYTSKAEVSSSNSDTAALYNGGLIPSLPMFSAFHANDYEYNFGHWITANMIEKYSQDWKPVETRNILGLINSVKFNAYFEQPELVAQNSSIDASGFIHYETSSGAFIEENISHTGNRSLICTPTGTQNITSIYLNPLEMEEGLIVKFWAKPKRNEDTGLLNENVSANLSCGPQTVNAEKVAQVGEWYLFQASFLQINELSEGSYQLSLQFNNLDNNDNVWLDDFSYRPLNSAVGCYVYDTDNKLLAEFGDQHFATVYQYDSENNLMRKCVETEKGLKTLMEQHVNVIKTDR